MFMFLFQMSKSTVSEHSILHIDKFNHCTKSVSLCLFKADTES